MLLHAVVLKQALNSDEQLYDPLCSLVISLPNHEFEKEKLSVFDLLAYCVYNFFSKFYILLIKLLDPDQLAVYVIM